LLVTFFNAGVEVYYNLKYPFNMKQGIKINVEEGTTSTNGNTIASSGPLVTSECKTSLWVSL
jgi:hypothetical protein